MCVMDFVQGSIPSLLYGQAVSCSFCLNFLSQGSKSWDKNQTLDKRVQNLCISQPHYPLESSYAPRPEVMKKELWNERISFCGSGGRLRRRLSRGPGRRLRRSSRGRCPLPHPLTFCFLSAHLRQQNHAAHATLNLLLLWRHAPAASTLRARVL